MKRLTHLGHVALLVSDIDATARFYTEVLGLTVSDRIVYPDGEWLVEGAWLRCGNEHHCLALFKSAQVPEPRPADGLHHLAFEVESFDALLELKQALEKFGSPIVGMRHFGPGSQVRLYCLDPAGYRVELYWGLDVIGWDGCSRPVLPIEDIDLETYDPATILDYKRRTALAAAAAIRSTD